MTNRNYVRGRSYEYKIAKKLRAEGWEVLRTAGSHGAFDLIAIKTANLVYPMEVVADAKIFGTRKLGFKTIALGHIRFIQCKSGKNKLRMVKDVLKSDIKKYEGLYSAVVEVL